MIDDKVPQLISDIPDTGRIPLVGHQNLRQKQSSKQTQQSLLNKDHIGSVVYGGLDGIITTFVIVLCACGVDIQIRKIMNIGISSLIANAISMAVSDYVSSKAEIEILKKERLAVESKVQNQIQTQKAQMITKYKEVGLGREVSRQMVEILSSNRRGFVEIIMVQKLGLQIEAGSPILNSIITFVSFTFFGFIPLIPLIFSKRVEYVRKETYVIISGVITLVTLFVLGFSKSLIVKSKWYTSSSETILLGVIAAFGAFAVTRAFGQTIIA